jgi:hypothetical protein
MEADTVYENKYDDDELMFDPQDYSLVDQFFSFYDFVIQLGIWSITLLNILTKEGLIDLMIPGSSFYTLCRKYGLTKNATLIILLSISYINKSKYIGTCTLDSY